MQGMFDKDNFYFWESKIRDSDDVLIGSMEHKAITKETVIVYIGIMDMKKDIFKSGWSSHEDVDMALGFLKHVFLPTAFYTWIDRKSEGFFVPLSPFEVVMKEVIKTNIQNTTDVIRMEKASKELGSIFRCANKLKCDKIKMFCTDFNSMFNEDPDRILFVRVFESSEEIVDFILENGDDEFEEVVEEEIGMTVETLKFICKNVYNEPFLNKTFIEQLNTKIPIWF